MELEDLKNNWKALTEKEECCESVSVKELEDMIHSKGATQFAKIETSIRVAYMLIMFFWVLQFCLDYFIADFLNRSLPLWLSMVDYGLAAWCSIALLFFVYKVNKIDWHNLPSTQVKDSITKFLSVLKRFRRNYFFCISSLLVSGALGTIYSLYEGITSNIVLKVNNGDNLFLLIYIITSIVIFVSIFFLVRRIYVWLFNLLFGKYMKRLEELNEELNSISS
ncbi:hypothetical protein K5X82_09725 [Halosquirtibacter xylanolyticus]|uniref:hypothetical protein n=1 Tax=Halosquirtibacter xylanolyticus TaxID=3374599 RepID=UPI0037479FAF|nr:hypothetical protein K5X82_09725 [Prolixibacteraceae bacterium]